MLEFRFSIRARDDLRDIGAYSVEKWGKARASSYLDQLEDGCALVARNPGMATTCDDVRPGYRRMPEGSHVLFFKLDERGLLVVRVLHKRMRPELHIEDSDEDEPEP